MTDPAPGETVVWRGRPKIVEAPLGFRVAAMVLGALAVVSLCFAVTISFSLHATPSAPLLFAAWTSFAALLAVQTPKIWLEHVEYLVTDRHVIVARGPFQRTIERRAISFARILWSGSHAGVGNLELVRAVPTGALRRRLLLELRGVAAPDRVWAIIRGVENSIEPHRGDRPLTQRLDDGERVVWSARPRSSLQAYLPHGRREVSTVMLSLLLFYTFAAMLVRAVPNLRALASAGLGEGPFAALVAGEAIAALLVLGAAGYLGFDAILAKARKLRRTRYLVTNRRVLIQRGREELHLDRERIVDVIPTPTASGATDVFLVLDGPRARALAMGGAFGEADGGPELSPVLVSVDDAESVSRILLSRNVEAPRRAA
ncbi:MAG TPA: hypothetical protein VHE30_07465 [Polyangiaceae bacterium]|nr:hypothetical protein [Polyangiaceae bacterium]